MRTSLLPWAWPSRRTVLDPEPFPVGYEAGYMPGSFEPVDTLGDTGNAPLQEDAKPAPQQREPRVYLFPLAVILAVAAVAFLAWALKR